MIGVPEKIQVMRVLLARASTDKSSKIDRMLGCANDVRSRGAIFSGRSGKGVTFWDAGRSEVRALKVRPFERGPSRLLDLSSWFYEKEDELSYGASPERE
jgi:hypothetical protein